MAENCSKIPEFGEIFRSGSLPMIALLWVPLMGCIQESSVPNNSWLIDRTENTGLEFLHDNGMSGERYFCEIVGPGVAVLDIDGDGDMDVAINQGHLLTHESANPPLRTLPRPENSPPGLRIFRNDGIQDGFPIFSDMTETTGIRSKVYGMGLAVSDVNNDGLPDILVTGFGEDELWISKGSGKYQNLAKDWGVADERWTTSAYFADVDRDGDEDLYVCSYVDFTLENHKPCYGITSLVDYCGPSSYPSLTDRFYRNDQNSTFTDWTVESGIGAFSGAGLGVACSDLDEDGRLDFYVANDGEVNRLWLQKQPLRFEDAALISGCALNREGQPEASMGAEIADYDGDGDDDLFLTHLDGETNTLYRNRGKGVFDDISIESGLGIPSRRWTGFGTAWIDVDNDSWLDLFITNGAVKLPVDRLTKGGVHPLGQPDQLYRNQQGTSFQLVSPDELPDLAKDTVGRGAAWGDLDNDGDLDLIVTGNGENARVLINTAGHRNSWIGFVPLDDKGRIISGVRFDVDAGSGRIIRRYSRRGGSYLSSHDPRVVVGLGELKDSLDVNVWWPNGTSKQFKGLMPGRYHEIREEED